MTTTRFAYEVMVTTSTGGTVPLERGIGDELDVMHAIANRLLSNREMSDFPLTEWDHPDTGKIASISIVPAN